MAALQDIPEHEEAAPSAGPAPKRKTTKKREGGSPTPPAPPAKGKGRPRTSSAPTLEEDDGWRPFSPMLPEGLRRSARTTRRATSEADAANKKKYQVPKRGLRKFRVK